MGHAAIRNEHVAVCVDGDVARVLEAFRDDAFRFGRQGREPNELLSAQGEQVSASVKAKAAWIRQGDACGNLSALDVDDQEFVLSDKGTEQETVVGGDPAEHVDFVATI